MELLQNKIEIIDEIVKKHESYGVQIGWSTYTGGMADDGTWFFRKMLDEPIEKLQTFLEWVKAKEIEPSLPDIMWSPEAQERMLIAAARKVEHEAFFGKEHTNYVKELIKNQLSKPNTK